jgi:four helix bundle protein
MAIKNYTDLTVWQKAMDLVEEIYRLTKEFPREELYGLTSQMRRAAVSIPSNIAEGHGRGSDTEFHRFLRIAYGSLRELETQVLIAERLRYATPERSNEIMEYAAHAGRLLNGLMNKMKKGPSDMLPADRRPLRADP